MGYNGDQVRAWFDYIGMAEEEINWVITYLEDKKYKNEMKL